jgi:hypothetical protein
MTTRSLRAHACVFGQALRARSRRHDQAVFTMPADCHCRGVMTHEMYGTIDALCCESAKTRVGSGATDQPNATLVSARMHRLDAPIFRSLILDSNGKRNRCVEEVLSTAVIRGSGVAPVTARVSAPRAAAPEAPDCAVGLSHAYRSQARTPNSTLRAMIRGRRLQSCVGRASARGDRTARPCAG